jgi:hypothetical protein
MVQLMEAGFIRGDSEDSRAVNTILRWRDVASVGACEAALLRIHSRTLEALNMVPLFHGLFCLDLIHHTKGRDEAEHLNKGVPLTGWFKDCFAGNPCNLGESSHSFSVCRA